MMNRGFNPTRLKVQLKLAVTRLKLLQQKKAGANSAARRDIAKLLESGKEESARIRVEHVIREDFNIEALEILELYCELVLARFGLIEQMKHCDVAIAEAVNTIIYAAPRVDVPELSLARDQLIVKYGKEFAVAAMENVNDCVNTRIVQKLKVQTPDPLLVNQYLKEIARSFNIPWEGPGEGLDELLPIDERLLPNTIETVSTITTIPQQEESKPSPPEKDFPEFPTVPAKKPLDDTTSINSTPDFDELTKRFEALKRRSGK